MEEAGDGEGKRRRTTEHPHAGKHSGGWRVEGLLQNSRSAHIFPPLLLIYARRTHIIAPRAGIEHTCTTIEIRKAYHRQALKWHPDKNKEDERAQEKFQQLQALYEILSDPVRRSRYDRSYLERRHSVKMEEMKRREAAEIKRLRREREERRKRQELERKEREATEKDRIRKEMEKRAVAAARKQKKQNEHHLLELIATRKSKKRRRESDKSKRGKKRKKKRKGEDREKKKTTRKEKSEKKLADSSDSDSYSKEEKDGLGRSFIKPSKSLDVFITDKRPTNPVNPENVWNSRGGALDGSNSSTSGLKFKSWLL